MKNRLLSLVLIFAMLLACTLSATAMAAGESTSTTPTAAGGGSTTLPTLVYNPGKYNEPSTDVQLAIGKDLTSEDMITFTYGTRKDITLDLSNMGTADANDMTVTPVVSNDVSAFPFKITKVYWDEPLENTKDTTKDDLLNVSSGENKGLVTFSFDVRKDAPSGYYPLRLVIEYKEAANSTITVGLETIIYIKVINKSINTNDPTQPATPTVQSTPRLIVSGFRTNPENVLAGEPFALQLDLTNTSDKVAVSNMKVTISSADEGVFLPVSGSSTVFIRTIEPGKSETITMQMNTKADLSPKSYAMNVKIDYEGTDAAQYNTTESVSVPVNQEARLNLSDITLVPETAKVGDSVNLMMNLYNMGKSKLSNVLVKLESGGMVTGEDYFAGNMDPGATSMMDVMIYPQVAGNAACRLVVSYEDEMGQSYTQEKEFSLTVSESATVMEGEMMDGINGPNGPSVGVASSSKRADSGLPTGILIAIIVAAVLVVIAIIIMVVLFARRRRKHIRRNMDHFLSQYDDENNDTPSHDPKEH